MKFYLKGLSKFTWLMNQIHFGAFKAKVLCTQKSITELEVRYNHRKIPLNDFREGDIVLFRNKQAFSHWILPGSWTQAGVLVKKCREVLVNDMNKVVYKSLFDFLVYCTDFIIIRLPLTHSENETFVKTLMQSASNPRAIKPISNDARFLITELIYNALENYHQRMDLETQPQTAMLFSEYQTYTPDNLLVQTDFRILCTSICKKEQEKFEKTVYKKKSLAMRLKPRRYLTT